MWGRAAPLISALFKGQLYLVMDGMWEVKREETRYDFVIFAATLFLFFSWNIPIKFLPQGCVLGFPCLPQIVTWLSPSLYSDPNTKSAPEHPFLPFTWPGAVSLQASSRMFPCFLFFIIYHDYLILFYAILSIYSTPLMCTSCLSCLSLNPII